MSASIFDTCFNDSAKSIIVTMYEWLNKCEYYNRFLKFFSSKDIIVCIM